MRTTVHHVSYEVMVEGSEFSSPDASIAMGTLAMTGVGKALGDGTPLHGEVVVVVIGSNLVDAPAQGAVVEDDTCFFSQPGCVGTDGEVGSQRDDSCYIEDHDFLLAAIDGSTEGASSLVVEVGDVDDFSTYTTFKNTLKGKYF